MSAAHSHTAHREVDNWLESQSIYGVERRFEIHPDVMKTLPCGRAVVISSELDPRVQTVNVMHPKTAFSLLVRGDKSGIARGVVAVGGATGVVASSRGEHPGKLPYPPVTHTKQSVGSTPKTTS